MHLPTSIDITDLAYWPIEVSVAEYERKIHVTLTEKKMKKAAKETM